MFYFIYVNLQDLGGISIPAASLTISTFSKIFMLPVFLEGGCQNHFLMFPNKTLTDIS